MDVILYVAIDLEVFTKPVKCLIKHLSNENINIKYNLINYRENKSLVEKLFYRMSRVSSFLETLVYIFSKKNIFELKEEWLLDLSTYYNYEVNNSKNILIEKLTMVLLGKGISTNYIGGVTNFKYKNFVYEHLLPEMKEPDVD